MKAEPLASPRRAGQAARYHARRTHDEPRTVTLNEKHRANESRTESDTLNKNEKA